jgi:hypothetical protein
VKLIVEAYIVDNMRTPFILGNDFASQYNLSIIRSDEGTRLVFGDTKREAPITEKCLEREQSKGCVFHINTKYDVQRIPDKGLQYARIVEDCTLKPETINKLPICLKFPKDSTTAFIEKIVNFDDNLESCFSTTDSLVKKTSPFIWINNFSRCPIHLCKGQIVGIVRKAEKYLDNWKNTSKRNLKKHQA